MIIALAYDHAGAPFQAVVADAVREAGHEPLDVGTCDDYPDSALAGCRAVHDGRAQRAIVVCGSGAGVSVAVAKLPGIRGAVCHDTYSAAQCVEHDDCNVLCLGARIIGPTYAAHCVRAFVGATFSGEERHVRRLHKVLALERDGWEAQLEEITS